MRPLFIKLTSFVIVICVFFACACAPNQSVSSAVKPVPTATATATPTVMPSPTPEPEPTPTVRPELSFEEEKAELGVDYELDEYLLKGVSSIIYEIDTENVSDEYLRNYHTREIWVTVEFNADGLILLTTVQNGEVVFRSAEPYREFMVSNLPSMGMVPGNDLLKGVKITSAVSLCGLQKSYKELGFDYTESALLDMIKYKLVPDENEAYVYVHPDILMELYLLEVPKERRVPAWEYVPGYPSPTPEK